MLDFTPDECQLIANALNVLAQRDGLSQPQQYAMSTQIIAKIQEHLKRRAVPAEVAETGVAPKAEDRNQILARLQEESKRQAIADEAEKVGP